MFKNYLLDYNHNGIAKHSAHQVMDRGLPANRMTEYLLEYMRRKGWVPVGIVEIMGRYSLEELNMLAKTPLIGVEHYVRYVDKDEALKTLSQDLKRMQAFEKSSAKGK